MATFSGRDARNRPRAGEIAPHEVKQFVGLCMLGEWRRVAVVEHLTILGAFVDGKHWVHPMLEVN